MDIEEFRKAGYDAVDRICDYYTNLRAKPVIAQVEPGYMRKALPDHAPEAGEKWPSIMEDYSNIIIPGITPWQHPNFFGYFPTACTFEGMLGDLLSSSVSTPGFNWFCSPAATELESVVLDWSAKMFGLDGVFWNENKTGGGVIQTTASDSALTAIVAARSSYLAKHPGMSLESLVIYVTTQTHSFGKKAAMILGLRVRALQVDDNARQGYGLDASTLQAAIDEDHKAGLFPFILVGTVGTTTSGAIDRIEEVGKLLKSEYPDIWLHVDAAWLGVVLACPEHRERAQLHGINTYANSLCINFHKWGLVNFDCSALFVRARARLIDALDITPEYLRTKHGDAGTVIDFRNWHLSLGRRFRSLKLWMVLRSYGINGFQDYIRRCIDLNGVFANHINESEAFEHVAPPSFALTIFRLKPQDSTQDANALNRAFHDELLRRADMYLTQSELGGTFCVRLAVGAARTTTEDIEHVWAVVKEIGERVRSESARPAKVDGSS